MRAFCITNPGSCEISSVDKPALDENHVLLKIHRVGFCGTDLSTYRGKNPFARYPRIPGHEIAAEIAEVGSRVPDRIVPGMRISVIPYTNCGLCTSCMRGAPNACKYNQTLGVQREGAMTEYITVPPEKVVPSNKLDVDRLVLVEPLTIGFHAVDRGEVTDSDTVLVIGCGMIDMGAVMRSALRGARVIASDIDDGKLATARRFGASFAVNPLREDVEKVLSDITSSNGPDVVIEAVGSPDTYRTAIEQVAFAGRIVCIGFSTEDAHLPTQLFIKKEVHIRGSRNATPMDFQAVVSYLEEGSGPILDLVTRVIPLAEAGEALRNWSDDPAGTTKIVVDITK